MQDFHTFLTEQKQCFLLRKFSRYKKKKEHSDVGFIDQFSFGEEEKVWGEDKNKHDQKTHLGVQLLLCAQRPYRVQITELKPWSIIKQGVKLCFFFPLAFLFNSLTKPSTKSEFLRIASTLDKRSWRAIIYH